jgi:hypothetical protein
VASGFDAFCFGAVGACPCGNTGLAGRGCDNSALTGGAMLAGSGSTSPDTVILAASGELATAFSIFLQGDAAQAPVPFGDGARCITGNLVRLYAKSAAGGSVFAPDAAAGESPITQRSALLGDPIPAGATRHYQVYYRDPDPSFCPAPPGNTWNVSSALTIPW